MLNTECPAEAGRKEVTMPTEFSVERAELADQILKVESGDQLLAVSAALLKGDSVLVLERAPAAMEKLAASLAAVIRAHLMSGGKAEVLIQILEKHSLKHTWEMHSSQSGDLA